MTAGAICRVLLLGGGGHAAVVADAVRAMGLEVAGCLDDDPAIEPVASRAGLSRLGAIDELASVISTLGETTIVHAAVGDGALRRRWMEMARAIEGVLLAPVVHPSAIVSSSAEIDDGVFIGPLAVVNARAKLGIGVIVNSAAIVEHDCKIGAWTHIAPNATVCGGVTIGEHCLICEGAIVRPGDVIARGMTVGGDVRRLRRTGG